MIRCRASEFSSLLKRWLVILICCSIFQYGKAQSNEWKSCIDSEYQKVYSLISDSILIESVSKSSTGTICTGKICGVTGSQQGGFIMQLDSADKALFAKRYLSPIGNEQLLFSRCKWITDGFLVIGRIVINGSANPSQTIVAKTDPGGNIIWVKAVSFDASLYPNAELQIQDIIEGVAGDIVLSGSIYLNRFSNPEREGFIARLNNAGTVQFIRSFAAMNTNINDCFGLSITGQKIWIFGVVEDDFCSSADPRSLYDMSIDYITGAEININRYCLPPVSGNPSFTDYRHNWSFYKTETGFRISGLLRATLTSANFLTVNFDSDGMFSNAFQIADQQLANGYPNFLSLTNTDFLIQSARSSGGAFQSRYSAMGKLMGQVYYPVEGLYTSDLLKETGSLALADSLDVKYFLPCKSPVPSIRLFKRNVTTHLSAVCVGTDTSFDQTSTGVTLVSNPLTWQKITENPFSLANADLNSSDLVIMEQTMCSDTIVNSHLKITGPSEICAAQADIIFLGVQNPNGHRNISWTFDSSWMKKLDIVNDSTVKIAALATLASGETHYLRAEIESCEFIRDSLAVTVGPYGQDSVVLGADTTICPDASFILKSSGKFQSYLWQNGSVDSEFHVSSVGQYSLAAVNYCGVTSSDTVNVGSGIGCTSGVFFPNAFSPNGDGLNDIFRPVVLSPISNYTLRIYNRFSLLLFESHSPGLGWDGTYHHQAQNEDTYVYLCHYTLNGQPIEKCSTVVLIH